MWLGQKVNRTGEGWGWDVALVMGGAGMKLGRWEDKVRVELGQGRVGLGQGQGGGWDRGRVGLGQGKGGAAMADISLLFCLWYRCTDPAVLQLSKRCVRAGHLSRCQCHYHRAGC